MKLIKSLVVSIALICSISSLILKANPGDPKEIFKIAGDFTVATDHGVKSEDFQKLVNEGWSIQHDYFGVDTSLLKKLSHKSKISKKLFDSSSKVVSPLNDNSLTLKDAPPIEQHFVYNLGEKVIDGKNYYVIDFRGTPDTYSWFFTDFLAFPVEFLDTKTHVHAGFEWNRQACMERDALKKFISKIESDETNPIVIVVGHSMGAAVATLEAAYFVEKTTINPDNLYLISFAEPCPGKADFGNYFEPKLKNYYWPVNLYDIVPMMPMVAGFLHFNKVGLRMFDIGPEPTLIPYNNDRHNVLYYREYAYNPDAISIQLFF